jgi:hypothetical protein
MASATDPTLDARLRTLRRFRMPRRMPIGYAIVGLIAGLALVLVTVGWSLWLAGLGAVIMGVSLYATVEDVSSRLARKRGAPGTPAAA